MRDLKIAHFINDDKFPDIAYNFFEKLYPNANDFYIPTKKKKLKYIKETPLIFINKLSFKNKKFLDSLKKYDFLILHSLNSFNKELVAETKEYNYTIVWIGWGFDYYDLISKNEIDLYLPRTQLLKMKFDEESKINPKNILRKILFKSKKEEILQYIDFFAPVLKSEYEQISQNFKKFPHYIEWNYRNSNLINEYQNIENQGNNILFGNSASFLNNHIDLLDFFKSYDFKDTKLITPLNYGNAKYANYLQNIFHKEIGNSFVPIIQYLPLNDYIKILSSCSNIIINSKRQLGLGTINIALYLGSRVFLRKENPIYKEYKNIGLKIFSIEDLINDKKLLKKKLENDYKLKNKKIISNIINYKNVNQKTRELVDKVYDYSKNNKGDDL